MTQCLLEGGGVGVAVAARYLLVMECEGGRGRDRGGGGAGPAFSLSHTPPALFVHNDFKIERKSSLE